MKVHICETDLGIVKEKDYLNSDCKSIAEFAIKQYIQKKKFSNVENVCTVNKKYGNAYTLRFIGKKNVLITYYQSSFELAVEAKWNQEREAK